MKKILSKFLVLATILSLLMSSLGAKASRYFVDVDSDDYFCTAVDVLSYFGIVYGYEDNYFKPDQFVTRAEMAALICRIMKGENDAQNYMGLTTPLSTDVSADNWASGYVYYAVHNGIVSGDGNGNFRPNDYVSYAEVIKMIVCATGLEDYVSHNPNNWAEGYLKVAKSHGITNRNVVYESNEPVNRADVAVLLYQATYGEPEEPDDEKYELEIIISGTGGIRTPPGRYAAGDEIELKIYPGTEFNFIGWTATAGTLSAPESPTCILTMPDEDVVVYAEFGDAVEDICDYFPPSNTSTTTTATMREMTEMQDEVIRLVNEERAKEGLSPLVEDESLTAVAIEHCEDMHARNFFNHTNPDGESPFDRMARHGISYRAAGENIAKGQKTAESVMTSWMNSEGHRANILSENFGHIGVGAVVYNGAIVWTQCFTN